MCLKNCKVICSNRFYSSGVVRADSKPPEVDSVRSGPEDTPLSKATPNAVQLSATKSEAASEGGGKEMPAPAEPRQLPSQAAPSAEGASAAANSSAPAAGQLPSAVVQSSPALDQPSVDSDQSSLALDRSSPATLPTLTKSKPVVGRRPPPVSQPLSDVNLSSGTAVVGAAQPGSPLPSPGVTAVRGRPPAKARKGEVRLSHRSLQQVSPGQICLVNRQPVCSVHRSDYNRLALSPDNHATETCYLKTLPNSEVVCLLRCIPRCGFLQPRH
jgi:hypothetical protein